MKHFDKICKTCEKFDTIKVADINKLSGIDLVISHMRQQLELDDLRNYLLIVTSKVLLDKIFHLLKILVRVI
jgi:hypothetical protein